VLRYAELTLRSRLSDARIGKLIHATTVPRAFSDQTFARGLEALAVGVDVKAGKSILRLTV
jgi:hypothetical protein